VAESNDCERLNAEAANTIMKARLFILTASLASLAHAKPFPVTPGLDGLVVAAIRERKAKAPHFAEGATHALDMDTTNRLPEVPNMGPTAVPTVRQLPAHPVPSPIKPEPISALTITPFDAPDNMVAIPSSKPLPVIAPMSFDPFTIKLQFIWSEPHGQWMRQLLKDIAAAKAAGDIETYNTLTARYSAWAEKYLRHDDPPDLDGKPGR
jgi:hypothetical protein